MNKGTKKQLHPYAILFLLVLLSCLLTYLIPAGEYQRVFDEATGQTLVVAGSYQETSRQPVAPWRVLHLFYEALCQSKTAALIWMIFITGGVFEIIMATGCMDRLCARVLGHFSGRELWVIPIFVALFSLFGFTMGMTTASVAFVPLGIAAAAALGLDRLSGAAMVALGVNAGFVAGAYNPFSVGIAQTIAELPLFSGAGLRWLCLPVLIGVTSLYIMHYAKKHRVTPKVGQQTAHPPITARERLVLAEFSVFLGVLTLGIALGKWGTADILVCFLAAGIAIGLTSGMGVYQSCEQFVAGCRKMMKGVVVVGIAAAMRLALEQGNIFDTITYQLTELVYRLPPSVQLLGVYLFTAGINFLVTSGSAKAALLMPILTPMADLLGLTRQSMVFAFQLGDGLTNLASPTSTTLNGVMAVGEISYPQWMRFYAPLVGIYLLTGGVLTLLATLIGY